MPFEYDPDQDVFAIPEPPQIAPESEVLTDERTGLAYGIVPEEDIVDNTLMTYATSANTGVSEREILPTEQILLDRIEANPEQAKVQTDILGIGKNKHRQMELVVKNNKLWNQYIETDDENLKLEIATNSKEMESLAKDLPNMDDQGLLHEVTREMAGQAALLEDMAKSVWGKVVAGGAAGAATGGIAAGPVGVLGGAATGAGISAKANALMYLHTQGTGTIYGSMDEDVQNGNIDKDIAVKMSRVMAVPWASSEALGFGKMLSNFTKVFGKTAVGKIINIIETSATEGGTEFVQSVLEDYAKHSALAQTAERKGEEFESPDFEDWYWKAKEQARMGMLVGGGMGTVGAGAGTAVEQGSKYSAAAVRAINNKGQKKAIQDKAAEIIEADKVEKVQTEADSSKPVVAAKHDVTGQPVAAAPLSDGEIRGEYNDGNISGTDITDGEVDDLVLETDPESLGGLINDIIDRTDNSGSDLALDFFTELENVLPPAEASAIENILRARADSVGVSLGDYIDQRGIRLKQGAENANSPSATTTFLPEGGAIIRAFQKADVTSIAHELGHIFRRDIQGADLATLEKWAGVKPGETWSRSQEEQFSRAWEGYLATGKAPTEQLEGVFKQFTRWMMNTYKAIKGSLIDIPVTPEVTAVMDRLLVKGATNKFQQAQEAMTLEQRQDPKDAAISKAMRRSEENAAIARGLQDRESLTEREVLVMDLKMQAQKMQDLFDAHETFGYEAAKATFKATLARRRKAELIKRKHNKLAQKIVELLKTTRVKKGRSKFGYEVQKALTRLANRMIGLDKMENAQVVYDSIPLQDIEGLTVEDAIRNRFVTAMVNQDSAGLVDMKLMYKEISEFIKYGKATSPFMQNLIASGELVDTVIPEAIGQGVNLKEVTKGGAERAHQSRQKEKTWRERLATTTIGSDFIFGWGGLLEMVSSYAPSEMGQSSLYKALDFFPARQQQQTEVRLDFGKMRDAYMEAYNLTSEFGMNALMNKQRNRNIDIGLGKTLFSRSELRVLWLYIQNERLHDRLDAQHIDETVRANVEEAMQAEDKVFAQALADHWQADEEYNRNNEVYKRMYGTDMPREYMYIPQRSEALETVGQQQQGERLTTQLQQDRILNMNPEAAKSLKGRAKDARLAPLVITSDLDLFNLYTEEMAHFRAFAGVVRLATAVTKNKKFRKAVTYEYGEGVLAMLAHALKNNASDGKNNAHIIPVVDKFRTAFVSSTIGASTSVMLKQLISTVNYWQEMPAHLMVKSMTDPVALLKNMKTILDSEYILNRSGNIDRDIKSAMNSKEYERFRINPTVKNMLMFNIRLGDRTAIVLGGSVYLQYLMKEKDMTRGEAMQVVAAKSDKTQQSAATQEQSRLQSGGSLAKTFTMYSTGPIQAIRQEMEAARGLASGRMSVAKAAKTLFIYQVLVPTMYSLAASGLSGDDMEETIFNAKLSMALGPFGAGYSVMRTGANYIRYAAGGRRYQDSGPFATVAFAVSRVAKKMAEGDIEDLTIDQWTAAVQAVMVGFGKGLPLQRIERSIQGAVEGDAKGAVFGTNPDK